MRHDHRPVTRSRRRHLFAALLCLAAFSAGCAGGLNDGPWREFTAWTVSTSLGKAIAESTWLFPVVEGFHLAGLALLGGTIILVDFRLLGLGIDTEPLPKLSRSAEPWMLTGLCASVVSGLLLFCSEATKFYSPGFWDSAEAPFIYKMLFLIMSVAFTFTMRRRFLNRSDENKPTVRSRLVGLASLLMWLGVGIGGRAIGFY